MTDSKTVVEDLAAWLTQIWDEEEAREMSKHAWRSDAPQVSVTWSGDRAYVSHPGGGIEEEMPGAEFLQTYMTPSPDKQVLARIAADRKILELHKPSGGDCSTCCGEPYMEEYWNRPTQTETVVWKRADLAWPCPTIRLLASPYADRPGFRPEWSVERQGVEW